MKKGIWIALLISLSLFELRAQNAQNKSDEGWIVEAHSKDNYNGVTLANGRIGVVSGASLFSSSDVILNGVYDKAARGDVSRIVRAPVMTNLGISIDGVQLTDQNTTEWSQSLNMREAYLATTVDYRGTRVSYSLRALRNLPYMTLAVVEIAPSSDITLCAWNATAFAEELHDTSVAFKELRDAENLMPVFVSEAKSLTSMWDLSTASAFMFDNQKPQIFSTDKDMRFEVELKKGETYRFALVGAATSSADFFDPRAEAERMAVYALQQTIDHLTDGHTRSWEDLWQGDIIIEGAPEDQLDVRLALYNLYSFQRAGSRLSVPPMGLSTTTGYNGHVFWDSELWMYPPMLVLGSDIARSHIDYRTDRLAKAQQRAEMFGYRGAMFPWESDDSGEEATPTWCLTGTLEHHITADIGIAFWNYYCLTGDRHWLETEGFEVILNVADFWVSRATLNDDGSYSIRNVVGANEYAPNVDDNAFTNGSARVALMAAIEAAGELGFAAKPAWGRVAGGLRFNYMADGTTMEHSTYDGAIVKQADVNLLAYPLGVVSDTAQIRRDLSYYQDRINVNGPAMGRSILSILYSKLGDPQMAYELFKRSYIPHKRPPFGVLSESANSNNPYFATGAGGMLQAVIFGFGGLQITDQGLVQQPSKLPKQWKSLTIKGAGVDRKDYKIENQKK
ncbi:MAG: glycoside hydrolase family 65 protein [Rikenellaceae bacterium]